jgi:CIC family chloride channel protein
VVEDENHKFLGMIQLGENINLLLDVSNHKDTCVGDIMTVPPAKIAPNDRPTKIILKFDQTNAWYLPVIEKMNLLGCFLNLKFFTNTDYQLWNLLMTKKRSKTFFI